MKVAYLEAGDTVRAFVRALGIRDEPLATRTAIVTGLMPDEPVFFLRARDALALPVVMQYLDSYARLFEADRVTQLEEDVDDWIVWRRAHAADVRDPD